MITQMQGHHSAWPKPRDALFQDTNPNAYFADAAAYLFKGENPAAACDAPQHVLGAAGLPGEHVRGAATRLPSQGEALQFIHNLVDHVLLSAK